MNDKLIIAGYGIFLIIGAYFGFKAGSKISLIMGIVSGILVFVGIYLAGQNPSVGYGLLTVLTGSLTIMFVMRLIKTGKMMPSGMLLLISLIALAVSISEFFKNKG